MITNLRYLELVDALKTFKGVSKRLSENLATQIIKMPNEQVKDLVEKIYLLRESQKYCQKCNLSQELEICLFCQDKQRTKQLMLFESSNNVFKFNALDKYEGYYFVTEPLLRQRGAKEPEWLSKLLKYAQEVEEVILAISPTLAGEITINYIRTALKDLPIKVTRFATGLPINSEVSYLDPLTLLMAYENKK